MNLKGRSLMVCGGAGFIGSHLVDRLVREEPSRLVVVDNLFLGRPENLLKARSEYPDLRLCVRDATNLSLLREVVRRERVEVVFDLSTAPLPASYPHPFWVFENNVTTTLNFCELRREGLVQDYVLFSSSEVYGTAQTPAMAEDHPLRPTTTYGAAKAAQDLTVQAYHQMYGLDYLILRPFNTLGPRQNRHMYAGVVPRTVRRILAGQPPEIFGDGTQTREFTHVTDVANIAVRLVGTKGAVNQVINISSGQETTIQKLVDCIREIMDYSGPVTHLPPRAIDVQRHAADTARMEALLAQGGLASYRFIPLSAAVASTIRDLREEVESPSWWGAPDEDVSA